MPDPAREFIVHTDPSGHATGAVLMQEFEEGARPIAFMSKKMKPAERNYPVYEQELLAILNALRAWRHYLGGRHFTVLTDHQSLQYMEVSAMATPRQVRWATLLSEFHFTIKYVPGSTNVVADGLSRAAAGDAEDIERASAPPLLLSAIAEMAPMPVRIRRAAAADKHYQEMVARDDAYLKKHKLRKSRGLLYRDEGSARGEQILIPQDEELRTWILSWAHDAREGGHRGGPRMFEWLKARVWWPKMEESAQNYAKGCEACQSNKPDQQGRQGLPISIATPKRAAEVICMDFIGPLPRAATGGLTSWWWWTNSRAMSCTFHWQPQRLRMCSARWINDGSQFSECRAPSSAIATRVSLPSSGRIFGTDLARSFVAALLSTHSRTEPRSARIEC